ncbi:hypothetical protein GCM10008932_02790 [Alkalibacterium iburiense]|uniref:PemK-like protein n=1 Tax=Alkalibacterium iburiense TaxID=290589 RepID=A0ABN0X2S0_9LACT
MKPADLVVVFIEFTDSSNGKVRPAIVIKKLDDTLVCFRVTSQFQNKSLLIKEHYYEIKDWKFAGLKKKSWIDIGSVAKIILADTSYKKIGTLSLSDIEGLKNFIENYYGYILG